MAVACSSGKIKLTDASSKDKAGVWKYAVSLSWESASDSISETLRYDVQQKNANGDWIDKTTVTSNGAYFSGLDGNIRQSFRARARDLTNNATDWYSGDIGISHTGEKKIGKNGGSVVIDDYDGVAYNNTQIDFPDGALTSDVNVTLERVSDNEYEATIKDSGGKTVLNPVFLKPVRITFGYNEDYVRSQNWSEAELAIHYFDNVRWVQVGSKINSTYKVVESSVYHFTRFKIIKATNVKGIIVLPNPFTPNGDNIYDYTVFNLTSSEDVDYNTSIDIFGIDGKYVRTLKTLGGTSVVWDGRDQYGRSCESGPYVYRVITKGNKVYSGTVIVAR